MAHSSESNIRPQAALLLLPSGPVELVILPFCGSYSEKEWYFEPVTLSSIEGWWATACGDVSTANFQHPTKVESSRLWDRNNFARTRVIVSELPADPFLLNLRAVVRSVWSEIPGGKNQEIPSFFISGVLLSVIINHSQSKDRTESNKDFNNIASRACVHGHGSEDSYRVIVCSVYELRQINRPSS